MRRSKISSVVLVALASVRLHLPDNYTVTDEVAWLVLVAVASSRLVGISRRQGSFLRVCFDVHERSDNTATVAGADLHGNGNASLDAAAGVVSVPHDQDRDHRVPETPLA